MRLNDPDTWISLWEETLSSAQKRRGKADAPAGIERWNGRARQFAENAVSPGAQDRMNELLSWLSQHGALGEGYTVLDVGAGSGRYAIPMAKMGCRVVALEPAEAMVAYMQERMARENITNITVLHKTWQDIDLDRDDMRGQFDLVFASMTPGIQAPGDLMKMIGASRRACYLSGHTREKWRHLEKVWLELYGQAMPEIPGEFLYRFGLVYALGFMPLTYYLKGRGRTNPSADAAQKVKEEILWALGGRIGADGLTDEIMKKIDNYVASLNMEEEARAAERAAASQAMLWFVG